MHDTRALAPILLAAITTASCGNLQHNDVLVFATDTKLALDVSTSAVNGGTPSFTLGYKRSEGVWMPLVVNGRNSTLLNGNQVCTAPGNCWAVGTAALEAFKLCAAKEQGPPIGCLRALSQDVKYVGSDPGRTDTYSVFASFGADTGASGGGKAALAQFFATGIAAQQLAANKNVEKALIAKEANAEQVDAANAAADEAKSQLRALGATSITPLTTTHLGAIDGAMLCWRDHRADYRTKAAEQLGTSHPGLVEALKGDNEQSVRTSLVLQATQPDEISALSGVTSAVCNAGG